MRIFFRLGDTELSQARFADCLAQAVLNTFRRIGNVNIQAFLVLRHRREGNSDNLFDAREAVKSFVRKGVSQLASAVRAEVEENNSVGFGNARVVADNNGIDKLISDFGIVGGFNRHVGGGLLGRVGFGNGVVGFLNAIPTFISVHCVVATADCGDLPRADFFNLRLKVGEIFCGTARRNVAPVKETVNINFGNALFLGELEQAVKVFGVTVNAAGRNKPE